MRAMLMTTILGAAFVMPALANAAEWRVQITLISGNVSSCGQSHPTKFMVLQDGNTLTLTNMTKRIVHMTIPLQPDGSATGEVPFQLATRPDKVRVKVPAGSDRRRFELLTIRDACGLSVDPA